MSSSVEERKNSDLDRHPLDNSSNAKRPRLEEDNRVADEIINIIENSPEKELLLSVLRDFVVPTQGFQVMNLINSITTDITGSKLEEGDKTSLNAEFSKFKGLLPDGGNWIDLKASGGAYPRYRFILAGFFEAESKKRVKKVQDLTSKGQHLSSEITKIQQNIDRIAEERDSLKQSLQLDSETRSQQNQILEKAFHEIEHLNRIHQEENNEVSKSNADFHAENTKLAETLQQLTTGLKKLEADSLGLINDTKKQRESHFSNTRKIAAKRNNIESLSNLESQLGPVQEEIKKYSKSVKEGEQKLEKLRSDLAVQVSEYEKYAKELDEQLQSYEVNSLKNQLEQETAKGKEMKQRKIVVSEELKHFKENLEKVKNQPSALDLDNSLQKSQAEVQRVEEVRTKNIETKQELESKTDKQKESIAKLEKEIKVLLENGLIEEQSIQILQQESAEKTQLLERDLLDFKLYEKSSLSAKRNLDDQIKQCDWKGIDKTQSSAASFIRTLVLTILCSLFCIILYNLPSGTLSQLFDI